jgi:hypothetical protein
VIGVQVQDHNIAARLSEHAVNTFFRRFEKDLEFFSQDRRKNLLQFRVIRVQTDSNHWFSSTHTANRAVPTLGRVGMITSSTTFFAGRLWKNSTFLIDVVVPRKIHEVYGLLVIGKGAPKL